MVSWRNSPIQMSGDIEGAFIFLVAIDHPMDVSWFQVTAVQTYVVERW
jgi:hypothetical protein